MALGGRQISGHIGENRIDPLVARSRHADLVESAVAAESSVQTDSEIVLSWRRCSGDYHVDPRSRATPHIITQTELALFKEPVSDVLLHAREEIDRLYAIVRRVLLFSLVLVFSITTWAQNTGRIHGTVKDPTGASIPAAQIAVTNPATGLVRSASTDSAGAFVVLSLPIGTYNVEVKAQRFTTTNVKDLVLHIGEDLLVDVTMRVGQVQEQVSVAAEAPLTDTLSPEIGNVIQEQRVQNLPLNGRNVLQLALLAPGVAEPDPGNGIEKGSFTSGGFTVSINGGRLDENEYLLDGVWDGIVYFLRRQ